MVDPKTTLIIGVVSGVMTILIAAWLSLVVVAQLEQRIMVETRIVDSVFCLLMTEPQDRDIMSVTRCWEDPPSTLDGILELIPEGR